MKFQRLQLGIQLVALLFMAPPAPALAELLDQFECQELQSKFDRIWLASYQFNNFKITSCAHTTAPLSPERDQCIKEWWDERDRLYMKPADKLQQESSLGGCPGILRVPLPEMPLR